MLEFRQAARLSQCSSLFLGCSSAHGAIPAKLRYSSVKWRNVPSNICSWAKQSVVALHLVGSWLGGTHVVGLSDSSLQWLVIVIFTKSIDLSCRLISICIMIKVSIIFSFVVFQDFWLLVNVKPWFEILSGIDLNSMLFYSGISTLSNLSGWRFKYCLWMCQWFWLFT